MIELHIEKSINESGATVFTLCPDHIEIGGRCANGVDSIHLAIPDEWSGCVIRMTITPFNRIPIVKLVPTDGPTLVTADFTSPNLHGTIVVDAAKDGYAAYTNDIQYTVYPHSPTGGAPKECPPSQWEQITGLYEDAKKTADEALEIAENIDANAGFKIGQGLKLEEGVLSVDPALQKVDEILADLQDIKEYLSYTDEDTVGLQVDYSNGIFKRLAGAYGKTAGADFDPFPMFGGRKRCNVLDDGTIAAYYGDADYAEDGSMGQVMVCQPAFYYKVVPLVYDRNIETGIGYHLRKANYYISAKPKKGFKLHPAFYDESGNPVEYILFSAYEGSMFDTSAGGYVNDGINTETAIAADDLLCSAAGVKPISGLKKDLNKTNLEKMAQARGQGWHLETIKAVSANQLLMMVELGTMNTQSGLGPGITSIGDNGASNCSSLTGSTAELGNSTGQASETINEIAGVCTAYNTAGKTSVTYRGMENPWGNIWKHINGVDIWGDGTMAGGQPYIADGFAFNESKHDGNYKPAGFTLPNAAGWINAMGYGNPDFDWLLMPSEIGGDPSLPVGDFCYVINGTSLNGYRGVQLGGGWNDGDHDGGFFWYCELVISFRNRFFGGRLLYVPKGSSENIDVNAGFEIGNGLKLEEGVLSVDTASIVEKDDARPVASAAVYAEIGDIEALLETI